MDILTIMLMAVALVCALLAFIVYRANSRNAEALVKMSADKSTAETELQIIHDKLEEAEKNQVDVREFQVENAKLQENLSNVGKLHTQVTGELNLVRERRDELQEHVQELTADVSRLEAELKNGTEALQKESNEKDRLAIEHGDLQQQHQKLTEERTQLDERVKNAEKQLIEREELHTQITGELKSVRERRDELQEHVQELTADVSRLEAELKNGTEALQKESNEKDRLAIEHGDLQQQHQKLTEERTQLDERVKNAEKQLIEREELHTQITGELKSVRERRDELQEHVQELTADVSRLEAELKSRTEALQKESSEKNMLVVEHDGLQQQHQKLTEERTQLDERVKNTEKQLIEREELHIQITGELKSVREKRDELQEHVQELTADVSRLETELKSRTDALQKESSEKNMLVVEHDGLQQQHQKLTEERTQLDERVKSAEERLIERNELEELFSDAFKALSSEVLQAQGESFKSNAEESLKAREEAVAKLVKPLSEKIETLDRARADSDGALREQIATLMQANSALTSETNKLSSALTKGPRARGTWGEMLVERALQLSGLTKGLHYTVQDPDQQGGRTDFIVHLPHERDIIIDSKVSLGAYLDAENAADDEERTTHLARHAKLMRNQVDDLSKKEYWQNLPSTADFVVMAIPDFALPPAVQHDPDLIDYALQKQVVLATFSTLVPLLKCVAMGWQERTATNKAREIAELGRELHDRLYVFAEHLEGIGDALERAVGKYNDSVGSFDLRVLVQARRFPELGVSTTRSLPEPQTIDLSARPLRNHPSETDGT